MGILNIIYGGGRQQAKSAAIARIQRDQERFFNQFHGIMEDDYNFGNGLYKAHMNCVDFVDLKKKSDLPDGQEDMDEEGAGAVYASLAFDD